MVERKTLVAALIVVIIASVGGYAVGQFSAPIEQDITTTSTTIIQTETKTTTSTSKITETVTSTTINGRVLPIPSPANSTAVIRGYYLLNGSIFLMLSIDKPTYVLGETVHIRGTLTNLTPNNISLRIWDAATYLIYEKNQKTVWMNPEEFLQAGFVPPPIEYVDLGQGETRSLGWVTADWNITGLDSPVSEGQYHLLWRPWFTLTNVEHKPSEGIEDTITFTITKQD